MAASLGFYEYKNLKKLYRSVAQVCPTLPNPMDSSKPVFPITHHLREFAQVRVHCITNVIQTSLPLTPSYPSALYLFQHQGLFQ